MTGSIRWHAGDARVQASVEAALGDPSGRRLTVLRDNPRRRLLRCEAEDGSALLVKHFRTRSGRHRQRERLKAWIGRSPAAREWRSLVALREAGVAVPAPLALGALAGGDGVVVERFEEGIPLAEALRSDRRRRAEILGRLGRTVACLHRAGFAHGDLHAGNVLVRDTEPLLLDLQHATRARGPRSRWRDLGALDYSLWPLASRSDRMRLRHAALAVLDPRDEVARAELRAVGRAARARADEHARSRTRRALRPGRLYARARSQGWVGMRLRQLPPEALDRVLRAHRAALEEGSDAVLHSDARSRVTRVAGEERSVVVKEFPARDPWRALADLVRGSPARRAWRAGHGLRARRIGAATPQAYLQQRRLGIPRRSILVLEDLTPARDALAALADAPEAVLDALTRLVIDLHRRNVDHGDLKGTHVFLRGDRAGFAPVLVDLEGVRFPRRVSQTRRLRALAELNASLPDAFPADLRCRAFARYARAHPFAGGSATALRRVVEESLDRRHRFRGDGCQLAAAVRASRR